jgi:hypothetical protein
MCIEQRRNQMRRYSQKQKQEYKAKKREEQQALLEQSVRELASSDAWANFIKFGRNNLRKYSINNALLIWSQKHEAKNVRGRCAWLKDEVHLNDDAQPLHILAPVFVDARDDEGNVMYGKDGKKIKKIGFYRTVVVYDVSDTDAPKSMIDPMVEVEGSDLAEHVAPLEGFAREMGILVRYREDTGDTHGWYDEKNNEIVINKNLQINGVVRTLIHELAHAYGNVNYKDYSREEAEVLVESATVMALGMIGFDTREVSVPYILAWGGDLDVLKKNLLLVETLVNELTDRMGL